MRCKRYEAIFIIIIIISRRGGRAHTVLGLDVSGASSNENEIDLMAGLYIRIYMHMHTHTQSTSRIEIENGAAKKVNDDERQLQARAMQ